MKHALFVAFHFPPEASSSGVLRTLKYVRYLTDYGWRVTVLTAREDAYPLRDPGPLSQLPASARVVRTRFLNTKRHLAVRGVYPAWLAVPDVWIGWLPWALAAGRRVLREDPAQLVYSTSPHATAHLIAGRLARAHALPWVADFRDPWFEEPPEPGTPQVVHWAARRLERRTVTAAAHVVSATAHQRETFRARYPELPAGKFSAIFNGYDEADFADRPEAAAGGDDTFTLVHAGNVNPEFRDPRPLFRAVRRLADAGQLDPVAVRLRFVGGGPYGESAEVRRCLAETGLTDRVEFLPRVGFEEALREIAGATALLLLQASPDTQDLVPAKLYEYLRAQKPVLALCLPGAVGEVLRETGGGLTAAPADAAALDRALLELHDAWRGGRLAAHQARLDRLARFDRRHLAGELAAVFEHCSAPSPDAAPAPLGSHP